MTRLRQQLIEAAVSLLEPGEPAPAEYLRGMSELMARACPQPGVSTAGQARLMRIRIVNAAERF